MPETFVAPKTFRRFRSSSWTKSPVLDYVVPRLAHEPNVMDLLRPLPAAKQHPVSLLVAMRYLMLNGVAGDHVLTRMYDLPEGRWGRDAALIGFLSFCDNFHGQLKTVMSERNVQTNEVKRGLVLLPAILEVGRLVNRPLALIEFGASAGLNLMFDSHDYGYRYADGFESRFLADPHPRGSRSEKDHLLLTTAIGARAPHLNSPFPEIRVRSGIDLNPLDPANADDAAWLRAAIWPSDVQCMQRLDRALDLAARNRDRVVQRGDMLTDTPALLDDIDPRLDVCLFSSNVTTWMSSAQHDQFTRMLVDVSRQRSIWFISFEEPGTIQGLDVPRGVRSDEFLLALQKYEGGEVESRLLGVAQGRVDYLNWLDPSTTAERVPHDRDPLTTAPDRGPVL